MEKTLRDEIYQLPNYNDIDVIRFQEYSAGLMLDLLIVYKHKLGIESYKFDGCPLSFWNGRYSSAERPEKNAIIIDGEPIGEEYYDELISAFVNSSIENIEENIYAIYLDPEKRVVQITSRETQDFSLYDYGTEQMFMGLLTKLLPWVFADLSEEQMAYVREVVQKIVSDDGREYVRNLFECVVDEAGVVQALNMEKLSKIGGQIIASRTRHIKESLQRYESEYGMHYDEMNRLLQNIRETKLRLFAIENSADEVESPITEMINFLRDSYYDYAIDDVRGETIYLTYKMPLTIYSTEEIYDSYIKENSGTSYFFDPFYDFDTDLVKEAYKHIMEDQDCTVWVSGKISLNLESFGFHAENNVCREHTGIHPHLNGNLSCFGDASGTISEYLHGYRMYEALNAIAYSSQQFTMSDSYAGENFLKAIENYECIECPDGQFRTFYGLMEAIEEGVL